jgi:hypothetical protein
MERQQIVTINEKPRVLLAGVDTLILNGKQLDSHGIPKEQQSISQQMQEQLEDWQEIAQRNDAPCVTPWKHEEVKFKMWPKGADGWKWLLKNGLIDVMLGPHLNKSTLVRIRFSSEYLWKRGVHTAVKNTHAFLTHLFDEVLFLQPGEIHLCADVVGLEIPNDYQRVFISRAKVQRPIAESYLDRPVYRHNKLETLQFSGHASPMSATIYNKPKEIEVRSQDKVWFYDRWEQKGWRKGQPVWRVECRPKRKCLHEMDIEEVYDLLDKIPALWAYCVGHVGELDGWLRMVTPNEHDSNRWRWTTAEAWQVIQQAFTAGWDDLEDIDDLQRERKREINLDRANAAVAGYTATIAAWLKDEIGPDDDVSVVLKWLYDHMIERWERKGTDFQYLRRRKQFDYHIS